MTTEAKVTCNPDTDWAVGRNDGMIMLGGISLCLYGKGEFYNVEQGTYMNFCPINRKGRELNAGFQIKTDSALQMAVEIFRLAQEEGLDLQQYSDQLDFLPRCQK